MYIDINIINLLICLEYIRGKLHIIIIYIGGQTYVHLYNNNIFVSAPANAQRRYLSSQWN